MGFKLGQLVIDFLRGKKRIHQKNLAKFYFIEILSECNLKCILCPFGSRELFQREKGQMDLSKFKKIVDKIKKESPDARIAPYSYCEPFLNPQLLEMIKYIKSKKMKCGLSSNFNSPKKLKEILKAGIDELEVSVSGFYQETYGKSHIGGDVEIVKGNLLKLREYMDELQVNPSVLVIYHMYKDNLGEDFDKMKTFTKNLGFTFHPIWAKSINVEMSLKRITDLGKNHYDGPRENWYENFPSSSACHNEGLSRILYYPEDFTYKDFNENTPCGVNNLLININWNGQISLCCCSFDDRLVVGDYLKTNTNKLFKARKNNLICKECKSNNYDCYILYSDFDQINEMARARTGIKNLPLDRVMGHDKEINEC